jgi:hypothetical protein
MPSDFTFKVSVRARTYPEILKKNENKIIIITNLPDCPPWRWMSSLQENWNF